MDGSSGGARRFAGGCAAAALVACTVLVPHAAYGEQPNSEGTAVNVAMEYVEQDDPAATRSGDYEDEADVKPPSPSQGPLPQTGDRMGALALAAALMAVATAASEARGLMSIRSSRDDVEC